jgi:hypothetical protein
MEEDGHRRVVRREARDQVVKADAVALDLARVGRRGLGVENKVAQRRADGLERVRGR